MMDILKEVLIDFWNEIVITFFKEINNAYWDIVVDLSNLEYRNRHKKFLKKNAKEMFKVLGLKPINIRVIEKYNNCCYSESTLGFKPCLDFGVMFLLDEDFWDNIFYYINEEFKTREDRLRFVLAHEIAHYFQYTKHPKWVALVDHKNMRNIKKYVPADNNWWNHDEYRQLPLEKNADKIALLLCKKTKKVGICP